MIEALIADIIPFWPVFVVIFLIAHVTKNYYRSGLNRYPGPFWARTTNLWRFIDVLGRRPDITHLNLHRKHGDVVRLGPNVLSFSSPRALKTIYGLNKGFVKVYFIDPRVRRRVLTTPI